MKKSIAFATAVALTLAFGMAYAADDQMPDLNATRDTGTELYEAFLKGDASVQIGSAAGGVRAAGVDRSGEYTSDEIPFMNTKDAGTELYESHLKHEAELAKGSSAGGVRPAGVDRSGEYTSDEMPLFP